MMITQLIGGVGPDVLTLGRTEVAPFVESGFVQPLDRFLQADTKLDINRDLVAGLLLSGTYKGKVYGLPVYNGPALLFYVPDD